MARCVSVSVACERAPASLGYWVARSGVELAVEMRQVVHGLFDGTLAKDLRCIASDINRGLIILRHRSYGLTRQDIAATLSSDIADSLVLFQPDTWYEKIQNLIGGRRIYCHDLVEYAGDPGQRVEYARHDGWWAVYFPSRN